MASTSAPRRTSTTASPCACPRVSFPSPSSSSAIPTPKSGPLSAACSPTCASFVSPREGPYPPRAQDPVWTLDAVRRRRVTNHRHFSPQYIVRDLAPHAEHRDPHELRL